MCFKAKTKERATMNNALSNAFYYTEVASLILYEAVVFLTFSLPVVIIGGIIHDFFEIFQMTLDRYAEARYQRRFPAPTSD